MTTDRKRKLEILCDAELHNEHLCYIVSQGFHLSDAWPTRPSSTSPGSGAIIAAATPGVTATSAPPRIWNRGRRSRHPADLPSCFARQPRR
jgi:hypothetical protein